MNELGRMALRWETAEMTPNTNVGSASDIAIMLSTVVL
jgi:hypothetical protein